MLKWESNYEATAIVTRSERRDITLFEHVMGKRVGTASFRSIPDMYAPLRELQDAGVRLFADAAQARTHPGLALNRQVEETG